MLIGGLYSSLKAIIFGAIMLIVMILVWAVVSVEMLHPIASVIDFPGTCERCSRGFADIFSASVTIFQQIVAGDSWGAISIPLVVARQHGLGWQCLAAPLATKDCVVVGLPQHNMSVSRIQYC